MTDATVANSTRAQLRRSAEPGVGILRQSPAPGNADPSQETRFTDGREVRYPDRSGFDALPPEPSLAPVAFSRLECTTQGEPGPTGILRRAYHLVSKARDMAVRMSEFPAAPGQPDQPVEYYSTASPDTSRLAPLTPPQRATGTLVFRKYPVDSEAPGDTSPSEVPYPGLTPTRAHAVASTNWGFIMPTLPNRQAGLIRLGALSRRRQLAIPSSRPVQREASRDLPRQPSRTAPTMAELLDSVNHVPPTQDLVLRSAHSAKKGSTTGAPSAAAASVASGNSPVLRRQAGVPDSTRAAAGPGAVPARQSRTERAEQRSGSAPSNRATDGSGRDVTDFKGWEIEFLASKVYTYLQRRLDIERERHGRPGFNPWL